MMNLRSRVCVSLLSIGSIVILFAIASEGPAYADPVSDGQWYTKALQLAAAHKIATGEGVTVAVIDSGVDASHPDIAGAVIAGADFSESDSRSGGDGRLDDEGHGTGMTSLLVGHREVSGVAPDARVMPVRVAGSSMRTNFAAGIQWAVDHGASIISISGGAPLADPREKRAIDNAIRNDIVVVAAVGNIPESKSVQYPARYAGVLAVGATAQNGAHSSVSVTGPEVMISAPGEGISLAVLDHQYAISSGTSDSTALVAGVAALVRSKFPGLTAEEVIYRLTATAMDAGPAGRDEMFGFGIVDPLGALRTTLLPAPSPLPSIAKNGDLNSGLPSAEGDDSSMLQYLFLGAAALLVVMVMAGVVTLSIASRRRLR